VKAQWIRVVDVAALGPFMVWTAYAARDLPTWARWTLGASGVGTVLLNAANLDRIERSRGNHSRTDY
jgi:hypothetical protein